MASTEARAIDGVRRLPSSLADATSVANIGSDQWWDRGRVTGATVISNPRLDERRKPSENPHQYQPERPKGRNFVDGTVLAVGDNAIECELVISNRPDRITLHRDLFHGNVVTGMPFRLEVSEEDGIRKPRILPREIRANSHPELRAKIERLMREP